MDVVECIVCFYVVGMGKGYVVEIVLGVVCECMLCLIGWVGLYVLVGSVLLLFIVLMLGVLV